MTDVDVKLCCARLYESELVSRLLGDSFHPGGAALTERLGAIVQLTADTRVVDVAAGRGTSAFVLADRFGCYVTGIDLSAQNLARAAAGAASLPLAKRPAFAVGDAERLPFADASIDAIVCECAFCTFPDKSAAAREFARVLRPGGRIGISDVTRAHDLDDAFADLASWIACIAGAMPPGGYAQWLTESGFTDVVIEEHDRALLEMVNEIGKRLFAARLLDGLQKIDMPGVDFEAAQRLTRQAVEAVRGGRLGYAIIAATKCEPGHRVERTE